MLATESEWYFAANKAYQDLVAKASKNAKDRDSLLSRAEKVLADAPEDLTLPSLHDQIDEQLKGHKAMASNYAEEAKDRDAVLGRDATAWETWDLDGKSLSLKDYRGKAAILEFWYRGCGWCIRAMPRVKQVADGFKGGPVAALGMSTEPRRGRRDVRRRRDGPELPDAEGRRATQEVPRPGLPDADHHRPGGQGRRHPRRLLADAP